MDLLYEELINRGVENGTVILLVQYLSVNDYESDAIVADIEDKQQSALYTIINDEKSFTHLENIMDDYINHYDEDEDNTNDEDIAQCLSIFDMDDALYLYYLSIGEDEQYYDKNGYGIFNRVCGDISTSAINNTLQTDKILVDIKISNESNTDSKSQQIKVLRDCWKNKRIYSKFNGNEYVPKCKNIKYCESINNISKALQFQCKAKNNKQSIHEYLTNTYLVTDFHHILKAHLNAKSKKENNKNFKKIHYLISNKVECNLQQCNPFMRHNRNRDENDEIKDGNNDIIDVQYSFYNDLLDNIHVYFLHSYDIGFRVNDQLLNDDMYDSNNIDDTYNINHIQNFYIDKAFQKLEKQIKLKRKHIKIARIRNNKNKFSTTFDQNQNINENVKEQTNEIVPKGDGQYSFGRRYWYWNWYKNNDSQDFKYNLGYKYSDWYIKNKNDNFKQEIMNFSSVKQFKSVSLKAKRLLDNSQTLKAMKCRIKYHERDEFQNYNIPCNTPIKLGHIISIIFYTDFTEISYQFSKSFRPLSTTETDESLKKRNSNYHFWSKYLRETVELYGDLIEYGNTKTYYHGVSFMYFTQFDAKFSSPTSTTVQFEVALNFSNDGTGIILELHQNPSEHGGNLRYFDCSLISCYSSEDERLFFGGYKSLQLNSIRLLSTKQNMEQFMIAMSLFNQAMQGQNVARGSIKKRYYKICSTLMHQKMSINTNINNQTYPLYIINCFNRYCESVKVIHINGKALANCYPGFISEFMYRKCNSKTIQSTNVLSLEILSKIFPNATHINYEATWNESRISQTDIDDFIDLLSKDICSNKLQQISVKTQWGIVDNLNPKDSIFTAMNWQIRGQRQWTVGIDIYRIKKTEIIKGIQTINTGKWNKPKQVKSSTKSEQRIKTIWITQTTVDFRSSYQIGQRINEFGQFGKTFRCKRKKDKMIFAVTFVEKGRFYRLDRSPQRRSALLIGMQGELDILRKLKHKYILSIEGCYESKHTLYIVTNECRGGNLLDRIGEKGRYYEKDAYIVVKMILEALYYMHEYFRIIHCDMKPEHILFVNRTDNSLIKIKDFGMSKVLPRFRALREICGTPYYTAPEILKGQYFHGCDMWSVGVITFVMLFGFPPFSVSPTEYYGQREARAIYKIVQKGFNPQIKRGYGPWFPKTIPISSEAKDFLARLMESNTSKRLTANEALHHPWILHGGKYVNDSTLKQIGVECGDLAASNQFKQIISSLFESNFSNMKPKHFHNLKKLFQQLDNSNNGVLSYEQFKQVLIKSSQEMTGIKENDIKKMFHKLDELMIGPIGFESLLNSAIHDYLIASDKRLYEAFRDLDDNEYGEIKTLQLKNVLIKMDMYGKSGELIKLIETFDLDQNGNIDYEEYLRALHPHFNEIPEWFFSNETPFEEDKEDK